MKTPGGRASALAALAAVALLVPAYAGAEPRALLAVGPLEHAHPSIVRQLRTAVCAAVECVPWGTVSDERGLVLERLRSAGIDGALVGAVVGDAGAQRGRGLLRLSLFVRARAPAARWSIPLEPDGRLGEAALGRVVEALERRLAAITGRRDRAGSPPDDAGQQDPALSPLDAPGAREDAAPDPVAAARASGEDREPARWRWLAVEISTAVGRRELSFQGTSPGPGPLRGHRVPGLVAPGIRLEVRPAAAWTDGGLAGLSLQGSYAATVGGVTEVRGVRHATRLSWLGAGVAWWSATPDGSRSCWSAGLSWERRDVVIAPAVPGLPDRRLSGAKAALGVLVPLGRTSLFASAGYVRWLEGAGLASGADRLFPGGSAWGLEAEGGVGLRIHGPWSVRLSVEYAATRFRLDPDPAGVYVARSARDDQLASRLAVRLEP